MNIEKFLSANVGEQVEFEAIVAKIEIKQKKDGGDYVFLTVSDKTGITNFPCWNNIESDFSIGKVMNFEGTKSEWNSLPGWKFLRITETDTPPDGFIPSYEVDEFEKSHFWPMIGDLDYNYKTLVTACINGKKDFFRSTAAERHHHAKIGGLFVHTYGMMKVAKSMFDQYSDNKEFSDAKDRIMTKVILHDIGKVDEYITLPVIARKDTPIDHLVSGSMYVKDTWAKLKDENTEFTMEENEIDNIAYSILSHHGEFGAHKPKTTEDVFVHLCDMMDSRLGGQ